jgi:hypothetical protein
MMNTSADKLLSESFSNALRDYLLLLEKGYPQKLVLKLVGDRYALSGVQRIMLYRGVTLKMNSYGRGYKLTTEDMIAGQVIHVDALNTLITVASYLSGKVIFISTDHLLRDASGIHGKTIKHQILLKALSPCLTYLVSLQPGEVRFYVDKQVNDSGSIHDTICKRFQAEDLSCSSMLCEQVDAFLTAVTSGIIATADSTIIDRSCVPIFDLPYHTLKKNYHPDFIDLRPLSP